MFIEGSGNATDAEAGRADAIRAAEEGVVRRLGRPGAQRRLERGAQRPGHPVHRLLPDPGARAQHLHRSTASQDQVNIQLAEYITIRLAGNPAQHAGDEALQDTERVFGHLWLNSNPDSAAQRPASSSDLLGESGVDLAESVEFDIQRAAEQAAGHHHPAQGRRCHLRRSSRATRPPRRYFTEAATAAGLLPRVDHRRQRPDGHHGVRPHLRPGAVVPRLRHQHPVGPHQPGRRRSPGSGTTGTTARSRRPTRRSTCSSRSR